VQKILLTNTRYALVTEIGENNVYSKDTPSSEIIARAENGVVAKIKRCNQAFCLLQFDDKTEGWMPRSVLYGIKKGEEIK
jgi:SH3-like domain-containing protein